MGAATVGVVLRAKSVDVVDLRPGLRGLRLTKAASAPIETAEEAGLSAAIRAAMAHAKIAGARAALSVPSQDVLLRSFVMPLLPRAEWATAIQFEARKYIPFKTQDLAWNFHVEELRATKQMRVVFVGIRQETLARLRRVLEQAGLRAGVIEAQAVSLARAIALARRRAPAAPASGEAPCTGMVDIDMDGGVAHVVIARGGVPYFSREVVLKREREPGAPPAAVDPRAEILLSELRLSFDFFTRENPQAGIQELVLVGDQVAIGPWVSWLAEQLHCPVSIGTLPVAHGDAQPANLRFACGVGVLQRGAGPIKVRLEFPERQPTTPAPSAAVSLKGTLDPALLKAMTKAAVPQALTAALLVGAIGAVGQQQVSNATAKLHTLKRSLPDVGWGLAGESMAKLQALKSQVGTRLAALQQIRTQQISVTEKLNALAKRLPEGVWLEGFNYDNRLDRSGSSQPTLSIQGACFQSDGDRELELIRDLADQLKSDRNFFRGFTISQLAEVGRGEGGRQRQFSYRTFKLQYNASPDRRM